MACLEEETILGFVEGRLDRDGLVRVAAHARECVSCDELLASAMSRPAFADSTPGTIQPGTHIGRYTVVDLMGVGGMSEVYLAHDPELDRNIALKVMRRRWSPHAVRDARQENRLLLEAQATARLRHPNVISVHDVGTFGARVFIAMEYVDGQTLSAWLRERRRSWREILPVFVDAARGLKAAHAAGLVHRDFKPQNVMVGRDGLVRVMDFGVATRVDDAGAPVGSADGGSSPVFGGIVGTPSFMSPEQRKGEAADARSDQFSFCVALYQALYGEHPFLDDGRASDLPPSIAARRVKGTPARGAVPAWLRRVITRGLATRREERWPSMDDLMSALARQQRNARRRALAGVGFALACAAVTLTLLGTSPRREAKICLERSRRHADAWSTARDPGASSARRTEVLAALRASKLPRVAETGERVSALLDRYTDEWRGMYRDVCETANVRHDQSSDLLELRMACLDDSYAALDSLTGLIAAADGNAVTNAIDAAYALPGLDRCAAVSLQHAVAAPKASPDVAARAADIRRRSMAARAAFDTGDVKGALLHAEPLLVEARRLGYQPLVAELLLMIGQFRSLGFHPQANDTLREAIALALRARRDDIAAEACILRGGTDVLMNRLADGGVWLDLGEALVDRMGEGQARLRSWLMNDRANAVASAGRFQESLRLFDQALELKRKLYPPEHPDIVRTMVSQAETLHRMGRDDEALAVNARALRLFEVAYGKHSSFVANALSNRGEYLAALGSHGEAVSTFREALAIWESSVGPDHQFVAYPLTGLGRSLLALGRPDEAVSSLERAAQIREASRVEPSLNAETDFVLAQALWATGEHAVARRTAASAEADFRRDTAHQKDADEVQSWLWERRAELGQSHMRGRRPGTGRTP